MDTQAKIKVPIVSAACRIRSSTFRTFQYLRDFE